MSAIPFVQNFATFQISTIFLTLITLLSSVVQARLLGAATYGFLAVISAFSGLLNVMTSLGQETTLTMFFSEAFGKKDRRGMEDVVRYFVLMSIASIVAVLLLAMLAPQIAILFSTEEKIGHYARMLILLVALQAPPTLYFLLLQLTHRVHVIAIYENLRGFGQFAICLLFLLNGMGIDGVLWSMFIPAAICFPLCVILYEKEAQELQLPTIRHSLLTIGSPRSGTYFVQGLWIALDKSFANNLFPNIFFMILNSTTSLASVGLFKLALRLATLPSSLIMPNVTRLTNVQIPMLIGENLARARAASVKVLKGSLGLSILTVLGAAVCIPPLLPYVYGNEFRGAIAPFLLLLPLNVLSASGIVTIPLLRLFRRTYASVLSTATGIAIGVWLYFFLLPYSNALIAMSVGVLWVHTQILFLHAYVYYLIRKRRTTVK